MKKRDTTRLIDVLVQTYGATTISLVLDAFKDLGFKYATQAGITISKNDVVVPPEKQSILDKYDKLVGEITDQYDMGLITQEERHEAVVEKWNAATDEVADAMVANLDDAQPDLHDGQLGCPRLVQADPPARRDARPDGQPEGRDHRASDQGQLHGGPVGARVLHLDPRRPQGSRRHRAAHRRLRLPDAASGRRRPGRDHPRGRLRHRGVHRDGRVQGRRGAQRQPRRAHRRHATITTKRGRMLAEQGAEIGRAELRDDRRGVRRGPREGHRRHACRCARCSSARRRAGCARPATAARWPPASSPRSATRSGSSPPSRSASPARS